MSGDKKDDEVMSGLVMDDEIPAHRKRSGSASRSVSSKRSAHKHDYEKVIIKGVGSTEYYWGRRCRICGRVDDSGMFKPGATDGLVKASKEVQFKGGYTSVIREFYTVRELRKKYPGVLILKHDYKKRRYVEIDEKE